jgi:hypothetical protein
MSLSDRYTLSQRQSREYEDLSFIVFELGETRHVIGRGLFGDKNCCVVPDTLLTARAKQLARECAARTYAVEALSLLRDIPNTAGLLETSCKEHEWALLDEVTRAMSTALLQDDAFPSASAFADAMKVSGFDELFHAFHDQWRPAVVVTDDMLIQAAAEMGQRMQAKYDYAEVPDIVAGRSGRVTTDYVDNASRRP